MSETFKIAIAGLGTVGAETVRLIQENRSLIHDRTGKKVEIFAVSAKNKNKDRGIDLSGVEWVEDPLDLPDREDIDAVIELIGGAEGPAKQLAEKSIEAQKPLITANKALLATHGMAIAEKADKNKVPVFYEAAIAGGIPVVKTIRESFAGNRLTGIFGILNGTCNYILSEMTETGRSFDDVLKEAQDKGYAEADPSFDVDGMDAAHKLSLLITLAFGFKPDLENMCIRGISDLNPIDLVYAVEMGYRIKLVAKAYYRDGALSQNVIPRLIPEDNIFSSIHGVLNSVLLDGDYIGKNLNIGYGAGGGPTASAVLGDIIDCARGKYFPVFGVPCGALCHAEKISLGADITRFYLRISVIDKAGVMAEIAAILKEEDISIESLIQRGHDPGQPVSIVIMTHKASASSIYAAVEKISACQFITSEPCFIRIEDLVF